MKYHFGYRHKLCNWWKMKRRLRLIRALEFIWREEISEISEQKQSRS